jgi:hypothetical protein
LKISTSQSDLAGSILIYNVYVTSAEIDEESPKHTFELTILGEDQNCEDTVLPEQTDLLPKKDYYLSEGNPGIFTLSDQNYTRDDVTSS